MPGAARSSSSPADRLAAAVRALADGALVVFPTDTLWGLGADPTQAAAVERLAVAKGRPSGQPLSVAVSSYAEVERLADLPDAGRRWVRRNLPGAYTVLAKPSAEARRIFVPAVSGGARIGLRIPDHPVARALAHRAGAVIATSANRHGEPPCRSAAEARRAFGSAVAVYLRGDPPPSGTPSALVDVTVDPPRVAPRGR